MLDTLTKKFHAHSNPDYSDRKQRMYDFLSTHPAGVLCTVSPDGDPHGAVIYYAIDKDCTISFITKAETRKYDNLIRNNHVMLTVFDIPTQATVQVTGKTVPITENYEINAVAGQIQAASLNTSDAGIPPIAKLHAGSYVAFRLQPSQIRMAVYSRPDPGEYTELFESVEAAELRT
jgi:uncharacterized pyridoxamine 5'-phosphate oxidase family protein